MKISLGGFGIDLSFGELKVLEHKIMEVLTMSLPLWTLLLILLLGYLYLYIKIRRLKKIFYQFDDYLRNNMSKTISETDVVKESSKILDEIEISFFKLHKWMF